MLGLRCREGFSLVVVCGLLTAVASLVAEHRLYGSWASVIAAPGPEGTGSAVVVHGLSCSVGSSQTRDPTCVSSIGWQILIHQATRKAPRFFVGFF